MLDGLAAVAIEIMLGTLQMMLGRRMDSSASSMCGCRSGTGAAAGAAGAAGTAGAGEAAAFGPAAAAGKASVKTSVAMMSRVKNPIFFKCSSLSEFRLGRNHSEFTRLPRKFSRFALLDLQRGGPRHPHSIISRSQTRTRAKGYSSDAF